MRRSSARAPARFLFCAALIAAALVAQSARRAEAQEISVDLQLESQDVYMGESFLAQLVVDGADSADPPDLSALENDFLVEFRGGTNNSSHSISYVNGQWSRVVQKGFVFSYQLTPKRVGRLTITPITVKVEGKSFTTRPAVITARAPEETEDFKLRIKLSRETCFVGEPVVLTVTWYIKRDVQDFRFIMPLLSSDDFVFEDPEVAIQPDKKYFRIPLTGGEVIAIKDRGILDGESYATLTFQKALIPKRSGEFVVPEVVVACESGAGFRSSRDMFNDFFSDDFFNLRRERLKKYVIPSNRLGLTVKELPVAGRPPGFYGHVGDYRISTSAQPTEVSVGDPITLTIVLEGPDYLGNVDLPPLELQEELAASFKIPEERADGVVKEKRKIFAQTIRAVNDRVAEIPPIELAYFDTGAGEYRVARSEPIAIVVHPTKVVTALDAEGIEPAAAGTPIEAWKDGIAFNYEGEDLLAPQSIGLRTAFLDRTRLALLVAPPALYVLLLLGVTTVRRRSADPESRRAKGALRRLRGRLAALSREDSISHAELCRRVMEALREYLGDKLKRSGSTLTAIDAERLLGARGVPREVVRAVCDIIGTCDAGAYAGGADDAPSREGLIEKVAAAARALEESL